MATTAYVVLLLAFLVALGRGTTPVVDRRPLRGSSAGDTLLGLALDALSGARRLSVLAERRRSRRGAVPGAVGGERSYR